MIEGECEALLVIGKVGTRNTADASDICDEQHIAYPRCCEWH
jgi:hypothetical protein